MKSSYNVIHTVAVVSRCPCWIWIDNYKSIKSTRGKVIAVAVGSWGCSVFGIFQEMSHSAVTRDVWSWCPYQAARVLFPQALRSKGTSVYRGHFRVCRWHCWPLGPAIFFFILQLSNVSCGGCHVLILYKQLTYVHVTVFEWHFQTVANIPQNKKQVLI